jgi:hypothetical protein
VGDGTTKGVADKHRRPPENFITEGEGVSTIVGQRVRRGGRVGGAAVAPVVQAEDPVPVGEFAHEWMPLPPTAAQPTEQ